MRKPNDGGAVSKAKPAWTMWAHRAERGMFQHACEDKGWVEIFGLDLPVVKVSVTESPKGEYYGWIDTGATAPEMIWMGKHLFEMCFTYGPEEEVKKGKGRIVRLDVKEKS